MLISKPLQPRPSVPEIRKIFKSAMAAGLILPEVGQGLMIVFNRQTDICDELAMKEPSSHIVHDAFFDLVKKFGFVVLKNCTTHRLPHDESSKLSRGVDGDGNFLQDPYHYDVPPANIQMRRPAYMSGIYKTSREAREMDTLCALEADVKLAIPQLDTSELSLEVIDALEHMAEPNYHFRLFDPEETLAREVVKLQYPDFVEDVFALIPEGRKYRQTWLKDKWDILVLANVHSDWLHARPKGYALGYNEKPVNPLSGLYLVRD